MQCSLLIKNEIDIALYNQVFKFCCILLKILPLKIANLKNLIVSCKKFFSIHCHEEFEVFHEGLTLISFN
jgi:hypothetical protein